MAGPIADAPDIGIARPVRAAHILVVDIEIGRVVGLPHASYKVPGIIAQVDGRGARTIGVVTEVVVPKTPTLGIVEHAETPGSVFHNDVVIAPVPAHKRAPAGLVVEAFKPAADGPGTIVG